MNRTRLRADHRIIAPDQEDTMQHSAGLVALRMLDADLQRAEHELAMRRAAVERARLEEGRGAGRASRASRRRHRVGHAPQFAR